MSRELAVLTCSACGRESEHELRYVGRLCQSTRCLSCGHVVRHDQHDLYTAYLRDLEHRVATKPVRLLRQAESSPAAFLSGLPAAVLRQPLKLARELWTLLRP